MAELIFTNGRILTQDPACPVAEALAVARGRIVAAGRDADVTHLAGPRTRRVNLEGRTVVPGFNDAHAHLWKMGHLMTGLLDLRETAGIEALVDAVRQRAESSEPPAWIVGRGYNEASMDRAPTAADLDRAAPGRPVFLTRTCGHIAVASSAALASGGVGPGAEPPAGGAIVRDERGRPTGVLHETAMGLVSSCIPEPSRAELEAMIVSAARHQLSLGVTSSSDAGLTPRQLEAYAAMDERRELPLRVNAMALARPMGGTETFELPVKRRSDFLTVDTIKVLADGGLSGATAALREPYRQSGGRGLLRLDAAELAELVAAPHRLGYRIAVHAIGDAAVEAALEAFEHLGGSPAGVRHRIEHLGLPDRRQLQRASRLRLVSVPQTIFLRELGANFRRYLSDGLLERAYPVREMLDCGLTVALSSDAPVVRDDNPLSGIRCAVERRDAEGFEIAAAQAVTVAEALAAYTMGGAVATGDEANRGSITPGKWADFAVLSGDPLVCGTTGPGEIRVEQTFVAGVSVWNE